MERKLRAQGESAIFVAIVVAALVVVNILAIRVFARIDLTKRHLFTLSDGTERIVHRLQDQLTITVYFTPNQPPPASDDERVMRDQLEEYRSLSRNRIRVQYVVPDNEARRHQAEEAGCTKARLQSVNASDEQATVQDAYRCVTFEYQGRHEKIPLLQPGVQGLEYEISSILQTLTMAEADRTRAIGFLSGHGELTPDEGLQYLPQVMEQERVNYRTRAVNLNNGEADVPTDVKGLIIANPTRQIPEAELRKLDAYLMRGGAIAVFAGGLTFASTDPTSATGTPAEHHLNDWLSNYGIRLDQNVVLDTRSPDAPVRFGNQGVVIRLVTWPAILALSGDPSQSDMRAHGGLDPSFPSVFRLPGFITPYPSGITINDATIRAGHGTLTTFARASDHAVLRTSGFDMNIADILEQGRQLFEHASSHGPYPLGVALQGPFNSAYGSHAAPAAGADAGAAALTNTSVPDHGTRNSRLMVVSSGSVLALDTLRTMAQITRGRPENITLLFNTFDWLSQDSDLLAVRAKDASDPMMRADVSDAAKNIFRWGAIIVLPLAIGVIGIAIMSGRRSRRRVYTREFGGRDADANS